MNLKCFFDLDLLSHFLFFSFLNGLYIHFEETKPLESHFNTLILSPCLFHAFSAVSTAIFLNFALCESTWTSVSRLETLQEPWVDLNFEVWVDWKLFLLKSNILKLVSRLELQGLSRLTKNKAHWFFSDDPKNHESTWTWKFESTWASCFNILKTWVLWVDLNIQLWVD